MNQSAFSDHQRIGWKRLNNRLATSVYFSLPLASRSTLVSRASHSMSRASRLAKINACYAGIIWIENNFANVSTRLTVHSFSLGFGFALHSFCYLGWANKLCLVLFSRANEMFLFLAFGQRHTMYLNETYFSSGCTCICVKSCRRENSAFFSDLRSWKGNSDGRLSLVVSWRGIFVKYLPPPTPQHSFFRNYPLYSFVGCWIYISIFLLVTRPKRVLPVATQECAYRPRQNLGVKKERLYTSKGL